MLEKLGAYLTLWVLLLSLLPLTRASDLSLEFFIDPETGEPAAIIVVGSRGAAEDVISASLIASKMASMTFTKVRRETPPTIYKDQALNLPLAYQIPSWEATIPIQTYNIPGGMEEGSLAYYKTWGITTHWTPDADAYVGRDWNYKYFDGVRVEYTLGGVSASASPGGLWWFDDHARQFWGNANSVFDAWETHEEIQVRFDDLYLYYDEEFKLAGEHFQDHKADLLGGDVVPENSRTWRSSPEEIVWVSPLIPGLIYRIDNIRRPIQQEISGLFLSPKITGKEWVDLTQLSMNCFYIPEPFSVSKWRIPKIVLFGKEYNVADVAELVDFNVKTSSYNPNFWQGKEFAVITGKPRVYTEEYIYLNEPRFIDGYEIRVLDVDIDSNKVLLLITMPNGYLHEFWMILDPLHGFSANPQVFSSTGEGEEYNGLSKDDVWIDFEYIYYRDSLGYYHTQYSYPLFVLDGIATFVGADGTTGALFNIYTLRDNEIFRSSQCCKLFTEKPNSYALWIDQMRTDEPRIGNYSQPYIFYLDNLFPTHPQWPQNLFSLSMEEFFEEGFVSGFINFKGTWDSIDSHSTTSGPVVIPFGSDGNPQNLSSPEAVPWPYVDRDQNDFVWWNEDCFSRKYSHWFMGTWDSGAPITDFIEGGNTPIPNADYMWEMNFALCDTIEMIKCEIKYEVSGPYSYFKLKLTDITWDDDSDGLKDTEFDDGIDFSIEFSVSGITYRELMVVELDEASLVKLDIEIDFKSLKKNLILVGGDQVNFIVERLVDERIRPDDFSEVKWFLYQGGYKLYTDPFKEGFNVLVVAGPDRYETRAAAEYLVRDMDF